MKKKNSFLIYLCIVLFGGLGIYLTFISGNTSRYDSKTEAYKIDIHESYDSDGTMYSPIYYFKANGGDYECKSSSSSSSKPNVNKKTVYYDSKDPNKCLSEYEKSSSKFMGIICIIASLLIIFLMIKKPSQTEVDSNSTNEFNTNQNTEFDLEKQRQIEESMQKVEVVIDKVQLVVKRVILGIIIFILFLVLLFDTLMVRQTIKAKNYTDAVAVFVERKDAGNDVFDDCIYSFTDKNGEKQEIVVTVSKSDGVDDEINIKYNENNPEEYYQENSVYSSKQIIFFVIKIIIEILLVILFFNKKLLSKINFSVRVN